MQLFPTKKHLDLSGSFSDPELKAFVGKCIAGDGRSQKTLYDLLAGRMFAVCLRYMGGRDEAEDVLQDGFVSLFLKLDTYSGEGSFEGWARRIFVNTALMSLRRKDVLRESADVDAAGNLPAPDPGILQNIGYHDLLKLIAELPNGFRTVFNMYVIEGYSHKEIAEALGVSETTSRSQLLRARALLQAKIIEKN